MVRFYSPVSYFSLLLPCFYLVFLCFYLTVSCFPTGLAMWVLGIEAMDVELVRFYTELKILMIENEDSSKYLKILMIENEVY